MATFSTGFEVLNNNSHMIANVIETTDLTRYVLELNTSKFYTSDLVILLISQ